MFPSYFLEGYEKRHKDTIINALTKIHQKYTKNL